MLEGQVLLVYTVVGEMHELGAFALLMPVLAGREPNKTLLVDVYSEWIDASHSDVYPHVELESVKEHRIGYVLGYHVVVATVLLRDLVQFRSHEDASALGLSSWFEDPHLVTALHLTFQIGVLVWKDESLGQESEVLVAVDLS